MLAQVYFVPFLDKNPPRTSNTSVRGWLLKTLCTLGESHSQLFMSTKIFFDLHHLLVQRYELLPSLHMSSTYDSLGIFLYIWGK
jgi:hypothetical protein